MKIAGANVVDPANTVIGTAGTPSTARDIFISDKIISAADPGTGQSIKGGGCIAMAGALDIHAHLFGPSQLAHLTGAAFLEPYLSVDSVAEKCLKLGITFLVEAGLTNKQAEPINIGKEPPVDFAFLHLENGGETAEDNFGFLTLKFVGDGGIEKFFNYAKDTPLTPHIHLPHLADNAGYETLKTFIERLGGRRAHLSHLSHYAFAQKHGRLSLAVNETAQILNDNPNVTFDCSPIVFGKTCVFSVDGDAAKRAASVSGTEPVSHRGSPYWAAPYVYKKENFVDSMLWISGIELALRVDDPARFALSLDFPSGGDFSAYPEIIACLMDKEKRDKVFYGLNAEARVRSSLESIEREYSLYEIAAITRSSPAAILGVKERGHLGIGAAADVVLYRESDDREKMFKNPQTVIKNGKVVYGNDAKVK
ncbi:MAG: amidohydrolase family protein [Nitrospinota bacterium]